MKKAMKLVWMVLFALPLISLTACGDDDEITNDDGVTINIKDYSDLLGKTRDEVMKKMNMEVAEADEEGIVYIDPENNVLAVGAYYTFFEENEYGALITYNKSVDVEVYITDFSYDDLYNFVSNKYGKGQMYEDILVVSKGNMYVWLYWNDETSWGELSFVDKKEWDKNYGELTKSVDVNAIKAYKARLNATR